MSYQRIDWTNEPAITTDKMQSISDKLDELDKAVNNKISLIHNCQNCGATLEVEENKPIFHCKYCGSAYVIGAGRIYSRY